MANELKAIPSTLAGNRYFVIDGPAGEAWNGTAFVAYSSAARLAGAVAVTPRADGKCFADKPAALPVGVYDYGLYRQTGGGFAQTDPLDAGPGVLDTRDGETKILAAVYDSVDRDGDVLTLSNGATQTITATGRETEG